MASREFYVGVLGFVVKYERKQEQFLFLTLDGVDLMLEGLNGEGRRWLVGELKQPLGRGVNFQWDVVNVESMYSRVQSLSPDSIYLELETKSYKRKGGFAVQKQFIAQDPDGYLFRFSEDFE